VGAVVDVAEGEAEAQVLQLLQETGDQASDQVSDQRGNQASDQASDQAASKNKQARVALEMPNLEVLVAQLPREASAQCQEDLSTPRGTIRS